MNKLLLSASALTLALGLTGEAMADCNGMYLAARGGVAKHKIENPKKGGTGNSMNDFDKTKLMLSGALGYRYDYFRIEGEYVWRDNIKLKNSDNSGAESRRNFKSYSYMLNGYFDLAPYSWLTPYVGAGIGYTRLKYKSTINLPGLSVVDGKNKEGNFTWSVGGGLTVKVTNRFNVDAGYRYYDMGKINKADVDAHEIYGGVRYVF